ncbi:MAG: PEP-CTERM sorting domain-containing protein [Tepidisphaeraceae bacterium]
MGFASFARKALFVTILSLFVGTSATLADTLYVASGSNGVAGTLYTMDPATGLIISSIGPLQDLGGNAYGMTGMSFDPTTGILYGATAGASPTAPRSLVSINPANALVTPIGAFNGTGAGAADISFQANGSLWGFQANQTHALMSIVKATGAATLIGGLGSGVFGGGGIAVRQTDDVMFITPDGFTGNPPTLRTIDSLGVIQSSVNFSGALTFFGSVNAMDFDSTNTLYGLISDQAFGSTNSHLIILNQSTGALSDVGLTNAANLDAMAFARDIPEPATIALLGFGLLGLFARRRSE